MEAIALLVSNAKSWLSEFVIVSTGLIALVILDFRYQPNILQIPNIEILGYAGKVVLLVIVAYFFGKIIYVLAGFCFSILEFIFIKRNRWQKYKRAWEFVLKARNEEYLMPRRLDVGSSFEIFNIIQRNPAMQENWAKLNSRSLFIDCAFGLNIFASVFVSPWFILTGFILVWLAFRMILKYAQFLEDADLYYRWEEARQHKQ